MLLKKSSLALGPCSHRIDPSSQGVASSSSTYLLEQLCSSLNYLSCCPYYLGLVPLILRVKQLPLMTRNKCSLPTNLVKGFLYAFRIWISK